MSRIISVILCLIFLTSCSQVDIDANRNPIDVNNTEVDVENEEVIDVDNGTIEVSPETKKEGYKCIVAGYYNALVVKNNGELWIWGKNESGQLGNGTWLSSDYPQKIMDDVRTATTRYTTWAIKENGELWGWGDNQGGQLGIGTKKNSNTPQKILDNIRFVEDGMWYALAIKENDELWGWGDNEYGQLGDGTFEESLYPKKIMDDVRSVVLSLHSTFVIKNNGELWGWGNHLYLPGPVDEPISTPVKLMENVKQVISGGDSMFVIKDNNELWGWGDNYGGALGDGTYNVSIQPTKIIDNVIDVIPGSIAIMAIKNNGELWAWGLKRFFDGYVETDFEEAYTPRKNLENVRYANNDGKPYVIKENYELWGWGYGPLGDGNSSGFETPKKIRDDILFVDHGRAYTLAIDKNNELLIWGHGKPIPEKIEVNENTYLPIHFFQKNQEEQSE